MAESVEHSALARSMHSVPVALPRADQPNLATVHLQLNPTTTVEVTGLVLLRGDWLLVLPNDADKWDSYPPERVIRVTWEPRRRVAP